jgi:hypothetical protein
MHFDTSITLGNIIEIIAFISSAFIVYLRIMERLIRIETKLDVLWEKYVSNTLSDRRRLSDIVP